MVAWDLLERHFGGLTAEEVDSALTEVTAEHAAPSSADAAAYLGRHGGPDLTPAAETQATSRRRIVAASTLAQTRASGLTLEEAAAALGVSRSRVSHRISDGSLHAITIQNRRYVPRWQLIDDTDGARAIPGLARLVPAIPPTLHPLALAEFMTRPDPDLDGRSPADWLVDGGDPGVVVTQLTGLGRA